LSLNRLSSGRWGEEREGRKRSEERGGKRGAQPPSATSLLV